MSLPPTVFGLDTYLPLAYGYILQAYIDGSFNPILEDDEFLWEKELLFRKVHKARKDMLSTECKKMAFHANGVAQRNIMDIALEERRELTNLWLKNLQRKLQLDADQCMKAIDLIRKGNDVILDSSQRIQAATLDAVCATVFGQLEQLADAMGNYQRLFRSYLDIIQVYEEGLEAYLIPLHEYIMNLEHQNINNEGRYIAVLTAKISASTAYAVAKEIAADLDADMARAKKVVYDAEALVTKAEAAYAKVRKHTAECRSEEAKARKANNKVDEFENKLQAFRMKMSVEKEKVRSQSEKCDAQLSKAKNSLQLAERTLNLSDKMLSTATRGAQLAVEEYGLNVEEQIMSAIELYNTIYNINYSTWFSKIQACKNAVGESDGLARGQAALIRATSEAGVVKAIAQIRADLKRAEAEIMGCANIQASLVHSISA